MGISIHYKGKIDNTEQIKELTNKLMNFASGIGWQYAILDEDWNTQSNAVLTHDEDCAEIKGHLGLKGIQLNPSGDSEPVYFFFDSDGNLRSPMNIILILDGAITPEKAWISVKTQSSSAEDHVLIVGLLKYVNSNYISSLEVIDEGEYWVTGDYQILQEKMRFIQEKIEFVSGKLSSGFFNDISSLSADEIVDRIERLICQGKTGSDCIN